MLISSDVCLKVISHSVLSDSFMFMNCQLKMPSYLYGCRYWGFVVRVCVLSHFSRVQLFVTLCTVACLTSLFMGFSRQDIVVGCHALLQGIFPTRGSNPHLLHWQVGTSPPAPLGKPVYWLLKLL